MRESNSHQRFWRPLSYHLTNPLYQRSVITSSTTNKIITDHTVIVKRRWRDLNPRTAINSLLPFQGSPFGQLGYFSKSPYAIASHFSEAFYIISRCFSFVKNFFHLFSFSTAERVGFEPTRPCGQTVFKTASL